jgi:glutaredoxin
MATILAAPAAMGADTLYKWVDKDGNVTYQGQPPPAQSGQVETMVERTDPAAANPTPDVPVVLYSIKVCDSCDLVRHMLEQRGIPFQEKNADGDAAVQAEIKKVAGVLSVPVVTIGDQVLTGYNKQLMLKDLADAGFSTDVSAPRPTEQASESTQNKPLTRDDLQGMTPEEIQQKAKDAALRGEDNNIFDEDNGLTLNHDMFPNDTGGDQPDDITKLEEIPKDEQIRVDQ